MNAHRFCLALLIVATGPAVPVGAAAQGVGLGSTVTQLGSQSAASSAVVDPYTVTGRVLNSVSGAGVPRALVTLMNRHVLTDAQGNFQFPAYTLAHGTLNVTKPGFSNAPDASIVTRLYGSQDLSAPLELKLYPNPVIFGVITGRDGLPISGAQVRLFSALSDINGMRWVQAAFSQTDSHGEYRFNSPPGNYRVRVSYTPRTIETGEMVMPLSIPEISSTGRSSSITLAPGQERRIDLQPRTGLPYPVTVKVDPPTVRNVRFTVIDNAGEDFQSNAEGTGEQGEFRLYLPTGSFIIRGHMDDKDLSEEGSAHVAVTTKGAVAALQLAPLTNVPVEVILDPASATASTVTSSTQSIQMPNPHQFNLTLKNDKNIGDGIDNDINLTGGNDDEPFTFRVPAGRYRLQGIIGGAWHVESATCGQTNLLTNELAVAQGSGSSTIRVVVDNRIGTLQGTVRLTPAITSAWVYLIPQTPSLAAINPVYVNPATGAFTAREPIGAYNVVAVDHLLRLDLRDPGTASRFSTAMKSVEITSGGQTILDLNLAEETGKGGTE